MGKTTSNTNTSLRVKKIRTRDLPHGQQLEIHLIHKIHFPHKTDDEIEKLREDLKRFLGSPLDLLRKHPEKILDSQDDFNRQAYLSLVLSHIDPSNADDMKLFTDSLIGGLFRDANRQSPIQKCKEIFEGIRLATLYNNKDFDGGLNFSHSDMKAGTASALINNDFSYTRPLINNIQSPFYIKNILDELWDNPYLNLQPGSSTFMSAAIKYFEWIPMIDYKERYREKLSFWKYINLDHDSPVYGEGLDFLRDKIQSLMKPPFVSNRIVGNDNSRHIPRIDELEKFLEASRENESLRNFVEECLSPFGDDFERMEKMRNTLSDLQSFPIYDEIMNTPGIENFSIEDWERVMNGLRDIQNLPGQGSP